jgi:hypothetical protein
LRQRLLYELTPLLRATASEESTEGRQ